MGQDESERGLITGDDGRARCAWGASTPDYAHYHDTEWGRPTYDERTLFEKICLEGFQSGLSWLTILRKRDNFRAAFADFDPMTIARYDDADVARLLDDAGIIRHRGKIEAAINNARVLTEMHRDGRSLSELIWSFAPATPSAPSALSDVPATTPASNALAAQLKRDGFRFVGPITAYAAMQAMGVVNDHLVGCWARQPCLDERRPTTGAESFGHDQAVP